MSMLAYKAFSMNSITNHMECMQIHTYVHIYMRAYVLPAVCSIRKCMSDWLTFFSHIKNVLTLSFFIVFCLGFFYRKFSDLLNRNSFIKTYKQTYVCTYICQICVFTCAFFPFHQSSVYMYVNFFLNINKSH